MSPGVWLLSLSTRLLPSARWGVSSFPIFIAELCSAARTHPGFYPSLFAGTSGRLPVWGHWERGCGDVSPWQAWALTSLK